MTIVVKINAVDQTGKLVVNSLSINWQLNSFGTASFQMVEKAVNLSSFAQSGQEVLIEEDGTRIFGGRIKRIVKQTPNDLNLTESKAWFHQIEAVCFGEHLRNLLAAKVYDNELAGDIIKDLLTTFAPSEGYTTTNVQDGPNITRAVFNYQPVLTCIEEIAELTGYNFYVDCNKDVHFIPRQEMTAPVTMTDAAKNHISLLIERSHENYRNSQVIRAGRDITDNITENFAGDGDRTTFTTAYPLAEAPTITVNTVSKTVGIRGIDTGKDWYWNSDDKEITQDDGGSVLTTSDTLSITYKGFFPLIVIADDPAEIASRATIEGGSGKYEEVTDDQRINVLDLAVDRAEGLLRRHGEILEKLSITTNSAGLRPGQLLTINLTNYGINDEYMIDSVSGQEIEGLGFTYSVEALSAEGFGGWIEFFKKLAGTGRKYVIRENEIVTYMRRFTDQVTLTDSLTTPSQNSIDCEIGTAQIGYSEICG